MQNTYKKPSTSAVQLSPRKRIAICADDFGMASSVDGGIMELARQGRLSAVSCMTQGPTLRANGRALAELPVDLGLHLNFTESFGDGEFHLPLSRLILASYLRLLPSGQVAAQINQQLDAFESCFARPPDFIDGHQHVHQLPIIRENLLAIIAERYPQQRIWLRSTRPAEKAMIARPCELKPHIIAMLGTRKMSMLAAAAGRPMNRHLLGVYDFSESCEGYKALLVSWFREAQEGDLLMCHPAGYVEQSVSFGRQRSWEYSVLADPDFPAWLDEAGLTLIALSSLDAG